MTDFPWARRTEAIISTVEVLPLEPVTATMWGGRVSRARMSGQIFRAALPGMELPLPMKPAHGAAQLADDDGEKLSHGNHLLFK